jgi:two-component system NtrC family sensor kinase
MEHWSNISIVRRVAALLFTLSVAGYLVFLLSSQYRTQQELEKFYLNGQLQDSERHATALGYFFSEQADDIVRLAESRELALYFENKALGMSMEYGLSASLLEAEAAFNTFLEKMKLDNLPIYSRVVFIDSAGRKLIDSAMPILENVAARKLITASFVRKLAKSPEFFAEGINENCLITISYPYRFKGVYSGQIIAQLPFARIFKHFVHQSDHSAIQLLQMVLYHQNFLYSSIQSGWLTMPASLPIPAQMQENKPYKITVPDENGVRRTINFYASKIANTPFSLATCIPEKVPTLTNSPKLWIIVTGSIGFIIIIGALIIIRTTLRNQVLQARLKEIHIHELAISEKNKSLQKLTTAVEQSANAVIITGTDGIIEYVNPYFTQLTEISLDEAVGNRLDVLEPEDGSAEEFNCLQNAICEGLLWSGKLMTRKKNGDLYWVHFTVAPIRNEAGEILSGVAIGQDITESKNFEEQIVTMNVDLEQRVRERTMALESSNLKLGEAYNELKSAQSQMLQQEKMASIGQLAAGIAHEINNPIGFMLSNLSTMRKYAERLIKFIKIQSTASDALSKVASDPETLLREVEDHRKSMKIDRIDEDIGQLVSESIEGGERIKQIVQNLKSFARLDEATLKSIDLNEGLESTINIVWNELKYKVTLNKEYGDIPKVVCNSGQINQVFLNMLVNAAQAIENKGEITVRTWQDQENVFASISDTGGGIPAEYLNRIFEPFFTTKDVGKGTGLGLSISYDIIKKHDGEIRVVSEKNKGTTFTIRLPLVASTG